MANQRYDGKETIKVSLGEVTTEYIPSRIEEGLFGDETRIESHYSAVLRGEDGGQLAIGKGVTRKEAIADAMIKSVEMEVALLNEPSKEEVLAWQKANPFGQ